MGSLLLVGAYPARTCPLSCYPRQTDPTSCQKLLQKHFSIFIIIKKHRGHNKHYIQLFSTILHVAQETEDTEEEVDEIEVEADRPQDILIGGVATVDEVCVIDDISTEYQCSNDCVDEVDSRVEWDEHANEACHNCRILRSGVQHRIGHNFT